MLVGVFERFTDRARRVLVLAQEEARLLNHNFIGTEHLLLGLIHEGDGIAARVLESLDVSLEAVRSGVEQRVRATVTPITTAPPFTPRAKKVLELALREALQIGHNYIGPEHLLLGLVREGEGVAATVLVGLGADLSLVRQQVITMSSSQEHPSPEAVAGGWVSSAPPGDGPRCPACRSPLDGQVVYRILSVPLAEPAGASDAIDVVFIYCSRCGVVVAHTPAGSLGGHLRAGGGTESGPADPV
jgi:ATP-dependent Clp protease ATP-binding subunit ClpC